MSYQAKLKLTIYSLSLSLLVAIFVVLSPIALAQTLPLGESVNDDSSETPIDTDVTMSEAVAIAERVLKSIESIGLPTLHTEDDGQVMWRIPYETKDGAQNEIIINTRTGAYRLVLEDDTLERSSSGANTSTENAETNAGTGINDTDTLSTTTDVTPPSLSTTTPALTLEAQIIRLLEQLISLLRMQLL